MNPRRKERIESLLKREIATCLNSEVRDPRLGFITVTRCELEDENQSVAAYYTVLGGDGDKRLTAKCLGDLRGYVQRAYAKAVKMRYVPSLRFVYDNVEHKRQDMDELIKRARASDPGSDSTPEIADNDED